MITKYVLIAGTSLMFSVGTLSVLTKIVTEAKTPDSNTSKNSDELDSDEYDEKWTLLLVNEKNPVPEDYSVELTDLANGKQVDSRIYSDLQEMFDAARNTGLDLYVREGYRTREEQQNLMDERIQAYENEGYTYKEAKKKTEEYVALPGTSEHELGISIDINANNEVCDDESVYTWLNENAYKYGFIKRYPENKTDITGINDEPWHYRYVGKKAAKEMKEKDLCLEEYVGSTSWIKSLLHTD
ncbi:MAG: M15 family metallopeptidase [Eubacterium sp.]|nr:M15 family metallopeptidase [Eubacterium sp.]